jgi:hypothetical protein
MMVAGFKTEHLIELAGIEKPYNDFGLNELTDKVFEELELNYDNEEQVVKNYILYVLDQVLVQEREVEKTLRELNRLCIDLDYNKQLYDFYSLYNAMDELNYSENQWYWEGANRSNILEICLDYFTSWTEKNKQ